MWPCEQKLSHLAQVCLQVECQVGSAGRQPGVLITLWAGRQLGRRSIAY